MKVMNVRMDRVSIGIGRDGTVPVAAVLHGSIRSNRREK
jgi:hypothetical protein